MSLRLFQKPEEELISDPLPILQNLFVAATGFSIRKESIDVVLDLLELISMLMEAAPRADGVLLGMDLTSSPGVSKENK